MTVTGKRNTTLSYTGGISWSQVFAAADNLNSNAEQVVTDLAPGFNAFTIPTAGSTAPTAVTIIPPAGNVATITLKGVTGDTGIGIHRTDPTTLALYSATTTFGLTASSTIAGVRMIYT